MGDAVTDEQRRLLYLERPVVTRFCNGDSVGAVSEAFGVSPEWVENTLRRVCHGTLTDIDVRRPWGRSGPKRLSAEEIEGRFPGLLDAIFQVELGHGMLKDLTQFGVSRTRVHQIAVRFVYPTTRDR